jgi:hypothetical protein
MIIKNKQTGVIITPSIIYRKGEKCVSFLGVTIKIASAKFIKHWVILPILILSFCSCKSTYKISGPIQEIRGDTLIGINHKFIVKDAWKWKVGDHVSFTGTRDLKIVNSKKIK